jgi:YidC/Oxa1 family membrane protein insertase
MGADQKRFFLAISLSGLVLVLWQMYFVSPVVDTQDIKSKNPISETRAKDSVTNQAQDDVVAPDAVAVSSRAVENVSLSNGGHRFQFQSDLTVENIFNDVAVFDFQSIAGSEKPFHIEVITTTGSQRLYFDLTPGLSGSSLEGHNSTYDVSLRATLNEEGKLDFHLQSTNPLKYRFVFTSIAGENENSQSREFIYYMTDIDREITGSSASGDGLLKWFGIDFNYHLFAFIFPERLRSSYVMSTDGTYTIDLLDGFTDFHGELVFTKKNYDLLTSLGHNLHLSVDFGFFGILAVPILRGLDFFYHYFPNYGIAIILLTLLIRMITFPLQYKSFKSMKKMQVIQPELQKLREKFKDDPQRMQKETMELFKRAGANPLGGCLPLIAQMPIFFAFYQVLYNAVELVGSPFIFWLTDLSAKDQFYVLPVLMGASLVLQMKLNPTPTTDPMQKKIMMFMPIVFAFIMKDLPSGLNLYMLISTLFGILQQMYVYKMTD